MLPAKANCMKRIITGSVIHGRKLGQRLGFPTANLLIDQSLEITNGVYAGRVILADKSYDALVNVGCSPTVSSNGERLLEAHLLDFSGDLYGWNISVELVAFLRPEREFASLDELRKRIEQDKTEIIKILEIC